MAADGSAGDVNSSGTLIFLVAIAYSASEGMKTPPSSVDEGMIVRLVAPRTDTSSRTPYGLELRINTSPSTS